MKIKMISPTAFFIASFFVLTHPNLDAFRIEIGDENLPKLSEYTFSFAPASIEWETIDVQDTSAIGNEISIGEKKYKIVEGVIQDNWKTLRKAAETRKSYDPLKLILIEKNDDNVVLTYEYKTLVGSGLAKFKGLIGIHSNPKSVLKLSIPANEANLNHLNILESFAQGGGVTTNDGNQIFVSKDLELLNLNQAEIRKVEFMDAEIKGAKTLLDSKVKGRLEQKLYEKIKQALDFLKNDVVFKLKSIKDVSSMQEAESRYRELLQIVDHIKVKISEISPKEFISTLEMNPKDYFPEHTFAGEFIKDYQSPFNFLYGSYVQTHGGVSVTMSDLYGYGFVSYRDEAVLSKLREEIGSRTADLQNKLNEISGELAYEAKNPKIFSLYMTEQLFPKIVRIIEGLNQSSHKELTEESRKEIEKVIAWYESLKEYEIYYRNKREGNEVLEKYGRNGLVQLMSDIDELKLKIGRLESEKVSADWDSPISLDARLRAKDLGFAIQRFENQLANSSRASMYLKGETIRVDSILGNMPEFDVEFGEEERRLAVSSSSSSSTFAEEVIGRDGQRDPDGKDVVPDNNPYLSNPFQEPYIQAPYRSPYLSSPFDVDR